MLCFPQISVLPKMLGLDPKHFHPSYNVSEQRNSINPPFSPDLGTTTSLERFLLKSLERSTSTLKAETSTWRCSEYPWLRMLRKYGLWKVRRDARTKSKRELLFLSPKGRVGGCPWSLWIFSWQWLWVLYSHRNLRSGNEFLRSASHVEMNGVSVHPVSIANWHWQCPYHL